MARRSGTCPHIPRQRSFFVPMPRQGLAFGGEAAGRPQEEGPQGRLTHLAWHRPHGDGKVKVVDGKGGEVIRLMRGTLTPAEALASRSLHIESPAPLLTRFAELFRLWPQQGGAARSR